STPMTTRGQGWPVRRATASGCSSGGNGLPSARSAPTPNTVSAAPRMRSALGFQPDRLPSAPLRITPSSSVSITARCRSSPSRSRCSNWMRSVIATPGPSTEGSRELAEVPAYAVLGGVAELPCGGGAHVEEIALEVMAADEALAVLDELPVELRALAQPLVLPLMRGGQTLERGEALAHLAETLHEPPLALVSIGQRSSAV